jgi:uncharacterized protein YbjT (DUF2867 family)
MKVVLFGATGMVGQGVLRECLNDARVESVLTVGRTATGQVHPKLRERVVPNVFDVASYADDLHGLDACFFCLGVSSAGMSEADYRRVTLDLTVAVARALAGRSPGMTFVFVSGEGTDATGKSRWMWARVKGEAENAVLALPFARAYAFRPGFIEPGPGIAPKTRWYRWLYAGLRPLVPVVKGLFPSHVTSTSQVGRAMINATAHAIPRATLETREINAMAAARTGAEPP